MLTCFLRSLVYRGILGPTPGRPSLRGPVQLCLRVAYVLLTCCLRSFVYPSVLGPRSRTSVLPGDPYSCAYVLLTCFLRAAYVPLCTLVFWVPIPGLRPSRGPLLACLRASYVPFQEKPGVAPFGRADGRGRGFFYPTHWSPVGLP